MPKHKIFIKIYLWFWLATIIIVLSQITLDRVSQSDSMVSHLRHPIGNALSLYGQTAVEVLERESLPSFQSFISYIEKSTRIQIFLFDNTGREVTGQIRPAEVDKLVALAEKSGRTELSISGKNDIGAQSFSSRSGDIYFIAGEFPKPPKINDFGNPTALPMRLCVFIIVSGVICYWLSHYFTAPIVKLNNAVHQFASGNFSVRVRSTIGNRKDEISGLAFAFDCMADRIESLVVSQRNLLRDVSHELRSPLARINVALEICRNRCNPEAGKLLDRIAQESNKLDVLIGQILTLNLLESSMSEKDKKNVNLANLIRKIVEDTDFEASGMNRAVKIVAGDECTILGNEELLRRAIENVLRNAVFHTIEGSTVEVSFIIEKEFGNKYISIKVRDYGPGVPEDEIVHLFEPFYWVGKNKNSISSKAGIGLVITETAVRFHGGMVKASNASNGGLIVKLIIPIL